MPGRDKQSVLPNSVPSVVEAIRAVLNTNPPYRNIREDADHTVFDATIEIPWSLISMPVRITVMGKDGQTLVNVTVPSRWWTLTDIYGVIDARIRDFFTALKRKVNQ